MGILLGVLTALTWGGSDFLARFATEQTVTINTAAAGGNAALLSGEE